MGKVKVYKDEGGEWRWTSYAENGEAIATSGDGYKNHTHALRMAQKINPEADVIDLGADDPR